MTFTVEGYVEQTAYTAVLDPAHRDPDTGTVVSCTPPAALDIIEGRVGEQVDATGQGPTFTLDLADATSVLAGLHQHTDVVRVTGDAPNLSGEATASLTVH